MFIIVFFFLHFSNVSLQLDNNYDGYDVLIKSLIRLNRFEFNAHTHTHVGKKYLNYIKTRALYVEYSLANTSSNIG